jgi:hypothetical protein
MVQCHFLRGSGCFDRESTQRFHCLHLALSGNNNHNLLKSVFTCAMPFGPPQIMRFSCYG